MSTEKRALLATFLSILFLIIWQKFLAPPSPAGPAAAAQPAAEARKESGAPGDGDGAGGAGARPGAARLAVSPATGGDAERIIVIETRTCRVKLTTAGARILSWRLLEYQDDEGHPLEMVPSATGRPDALPLEMIALGDAARTRKLNEAIYDCDGPKHSAAGQEVTCRWSDGDTASVDKTLLLPDQGYVATLKIRAAAPDAGRLFVAWAPGLLREEDPLAKDQPARATRLVLADAGGLERAAAETGGRWEAAAKTGAWGGIEGNYFAAAFLPETAPAHFAMLGRARDKERPALAGVAWAPEGAATARLFVGPKSYDVLRGVDAELRAGFSRLLDFGYFEFIAVPLFLAMRWLNRHLHSYGLAIIALTVVIKLVFYPITQRAMVSMRRLQTQMKRIQPRIQHLKEQQAKKGRTLQGRQELQQQTMELYRKEGINPMAGMTGCLPLLLQIPILWAFYNLLSSAIELRRAPFIYLDDLSGHDPYYVLPIIMGITMWIQQQMSGTAAPEAAQRWMLNLMPVFMTYVFLKFPSGLVLYWLVNNVLSIGQQYLINQQAAAAEVAVGRERPAARRS